MTVQRENLDVAETEVVQEAESVLEGTPVVEPEPVPAPPTEVPKPDKKEDPEVTPMCCGGGPGFPFARPLPISEGAVDSGGDVEHNHDCPNHPNNITV
ncbi:hypothetical protein SAMN04488074_11192 [Lentzea albidocapillata subsp. violacea]|uniref:Uncharacterized protein n=1 Tax=Lentzea albidocapillata subsp. violacea TaxID=128104 RepID=A0A1G9KCC6_9PSEU|nr:hypothetical protein [Lentzea albidocapillata]SDL46963.1 hypothetical protein SAMN04488074_11192 [Lentzea albidocapillata subsp. violacea]